MRPRSRGLCIAMMLLTISGAGMAQSGGGGVGGTLGGIGGALGGGGGTVGGAIGGVGGTVGGTLGGVGSSVGNLGGPFSAVGNSVGALGNGVGSGTQMIGGRLVSTSIGQTFDVTRQDIERELKSNLDQMDYGLWMQHVPAATCSIFASCAWRNW